MKLNKDSQKDAHSSIYSVVKDYIPKGVLSSKNKAKTWQYGYNEKYDFVVISKTGQVGEVVNISGLHIGLPVTPKHVSLGLKPKASSTGSGKNFLKNFLRYTLYFSGMKCRPLLRINGWTT